MIYFDVISVLCARIAHSLITMELNVAKGKNEKRRRKENVLIRRWKERKQNAILDKWFLFTHTHTHPAEKRSVVCLQAAWRNATNKLLILKSKWEKAKKQIDLWCGFSMCSLLFWEHFWPISVQLGVTKKDAKKFPWKIVFFFQFYLHFINIYRKYHKFFFVCPQIDIAHTTTTSRSLPQCKTTW